MTPIPASPNKALWEKGDFGKIAEFVRQSGEELVQSLNVAPPLRALDLGCGDGTTALPLAQAGADVTGIDISRNLLAAGRRRAAEAGLSNLTFLEGDACALDGVPDASFDLTLSVFGAMFAPRPFDVAKEIVRVTKPGGRIVMTNWIPDDPTWVSQMLKIGSAFAPPPPEGSVSPMLWGDEEQVTVRFGEAGIAKEKIAFARGTFWFEAPGKSPEQFVETYENFFGPVMNAIEAARENDKERELHSRLVDLATRLNRSGSDGVRVPAAYLRVTVSV